MKNLITILILFVAAGCGKDNQPVNTYENKNRVGFLSHRAEAKPVKEITPTDQNTTKAKPVKELTLEEKVVGEYEYKNGFGDTFKYVFLENGIRKFYYNGKEEKSPDQGEDKWSIVEEEIHVINDSERIDVHRINTDKSITWVATIDREKRRIDYPYLTQRTYKKIK